MCLEKLITQFIERGRREIVFLLQVGQQYISGSFDMEAAGIGFSRIKGVILMQLVRGSTAATEQKIFAAFLALSHTGLNGCVDCNKFFMLCNIVKVCIKDIAIREPSIMMMVKREELRRKRRNIAFVIEAQNTAWRVSVG